MTRKSGCRYLVLVASLLIGACTDNFSTAQNTLTGHPRIYVMSREAALKIAHDAIAESFPDSDIETDAAPALGYSVPVRSGLNTATQQVVVHPVVGVTAAGARIDGYTFEVSRSGIPGPGDMTTASFFARLQQDLGATGNAVDVAEIRPRAP
jgi:hypothetical protein